MKELLVLDCRARIEGQDGDSPPVLEMASETSVRFDEFGHGSSARREGEPAPGLFLVADDGRHELAFRHPGEPRPQVKRLRAPPLFHQAHVVCVQDVHVSAWNDGVAWVSGTPGIPDQAASPRQMRDPQRSCPRSAPTRASRRAPHRAPLRGGGPVPPPARGLAFQAQLHSRCTSACALSAHPSPPSMSRTAQAQRRGASATSPRAPSRPGCADARLPRPPRSPARRAASSPPPRRPSCARRRDRPAGPAA